WKYYYEDVDQTRKLIAFTGFDNAELDNLSANISTTGISFANSVRETHVMPRITTVTDVSAGTYTGIKVRIYYLQEELDNTRISGAVTDTWIKYSGDASSVLADMQDDGRLGAPAEPLTPDATGIEDGVSFVEFHNITSFSSFIYVSSTETINAVLPVRFAR